MAARGSKQPRELVRLTPLQFSLSVSIVVVLMGAAALAGYFHGLKTASLRTASQEGKQTDAWNPAADPAGDHGDTQASVTFYSTLTRPREDVPEGPPPKEKASVKPEKKIPAPVPAPDAGVKEGPAGGGGVMVQVASYTDQGKAGKLLQELSDNGYAGTVVRADLGDRGVWYRVRVGPYPAGDADGILKRLREERELKGFVVK